jgi:hypothetical protein
MMKKKEQKITVKGIIITTNIVDNEDYISLTDIARIKNPVEPKDVVKNWLRSKSTIEYIGLWETLYNSNFKGVEFDSLLKEAGSNSFTLSPTKWIDSTNSIGIVSKQGKNGGTFAHIDIALEFASWVSSEFKLYFIKEFKRLKIEENNKEKLDWNLQRTISKINYKIHTDAIKENLIPKEISKTQASFVYASEADILNVAIFGKTAKEWKEEALENLGNIRDEATIEQLVVLSNLESINSLLIQQNLSQNERIIQLNKVAISQMISLVRNRNVQQLK